MALLCSLADIVLFSAAQPGQGGEFHLNERPLAYWQRSFGRLGFQTFDAVRPLIADDRRAEAWYRRNVLMFANERGQRRMSDRFLATETCEVVSNSAGRDWAWDLRRMLLRPMPPAIVTAVSQQSSALKAMLRNVPPLRDKIKSGRGNPSATGGLSRVSGSDVAN